MTLSDVIIESYAQIGSRQLISQYVPLARNLGLTVEDITKLIKRVAEIAVETLNQQPP